MIYKKVYGSECLFVEKERTLAYI